jgi:hypothetical protein
MGLVVAQLADPARRVGAAGVDITAALSWHGLPYAWRDRAAREEN